jgi:hypothetical protein
VADVVVKFNGPCCFCGRMIDDTALDPCNVTVETKEGLWQVWYCHPFALKSASLRIHGSIYRPPISDATEQHAA